MRQISIVPSGMNPHEVMTNISMTGERFLFASTLAVYVYDVTTLSIEKVITLTDRTITSFALSPHDNNLLVIGTLGGRLYLWDIEQHRIISLLFCDSYKVRCPLVMWDPHNADAVYTIAEGQPYAKMVYWTSISQANPYMLVFSDITDHKAKVTLARPNPHTPKLVAVGTDDGEVMLLEAGASTKTAMNSLTGVKGNKVKSLKMKDSKADSGEVVDLAWDRLSSIYLLVVYRNGMILWDAESGEEINVFDKAACAAVSSITWLEWAVGSFVTTTGKDNSLKFWNASQKTPLETVMVDDGEGGSGGMAVMGAAGGLLSPSKGGGTSTRGGGLSKKREGGILAVSIDAESRSCLLAHVDGSVSVYNLRERLRVFKGSAGHQETIFDAEFCPTDPDVFASCSYDATVKVWNVSTFALLKTLRGASICIYSLTWSPSGKLIAGSCANGDVCVWDVAAGILKARHNHHSGAPSFSVSWNKVNTTILASSSSNCCMVIFQVKEEALVDTGVMTGNYRVERGRDGHMSGSLKNLRSGGKGGLFGEDAKRKGGKGTGRDDIDPSDVKMRVNLPAPIFGVDFSPLIPNLVLAATQDGLVRMFDYYSQTPLVCVMKGHKSRVFQVKWNPLDEQTIASGSDDGTIRIWRIPVSYLDATTGNPESPATSVKTSSPARHLDESGGPGDAAIVDLSTNKPMLTMSSLIKGTITGGSILTPAKERAGNNVLVFSEVRVLQGHRSNVRALEWNHELKNMILSGSWDATIRVWDVLSGACLQRVTAHVADVYALTGHPHRPFTYLSVSRDNTIRLWEMGRAGALRGCFAQSIWEAGLETARSGGNSNGNDGAPGGSTTYPYGEERDPDLAPNTPYKPARPEKPPRNKGETPSGVDKSEGKSSTGDNSQATPAPAPAPARARAPAVRISDKSVLYQMTGKQSLLLMGQLRAQPEDDTAAADGGGDGGGGGSARTATATAATPSRAWKTTAPPPPHKAWTITERLSLAKRYYRLFNFFCGDNGCLDVWEAALALLEAERDGRATDGSQVLHSSLLLRDPSCRHICSPGEIVAQGHRQVQGSHTHTHGKHKQALTAASAAAQGGQMATPGPGPGTPTRAHTDTDMDLADSNEGLSERAKQEIRAAAAAHIRIGDFREYCRLLISLGDYPAALAMAPCVSMDYWRELAAAYAERMAGRGQPMCAPFFVATGAPHRAADFFLGRRDVTGAMIAASSAYAYERSREGAGGGGVSIAASNPVVSGVDGAGAGAGAGASRAQSASVSGNLSTLSSMYIGEGEDDENDALGGGACSRTSSPLARAVNAATADLLISNGHPILAAAQHLSCGELEMAVKVLIGCDEYELAFAVAVVLQLNSVHVRMLWAHQVQERLGDTPLALKILSSLPQEAEKEKCLLISTRCTTQAVLKEAFLFYGVRPIVSWNTLAGEQEILGKEENAIAPLVLTLQHAKAVNKALVLLKAYIRDPLELPPGAVAAYNSLKFVRATLLDAPVRHSFLMHMLWFGAHEAASHGLWDTASDMLRILRGWALKVTFPVSSREVLMQETLFRVLAVHGFGDRKRAFHKATELLKAQGERYQSEGGDGASAAQVVRLLGLLHGLVTKKYLHKAGLCKSGSGAGAGAGAGAGEDRGVVAEAEAEAGVDGRHGESARHHSYSHITSESEILGGLYAAEIREAVVQVSSILGLPSLQRVPHSRPSSGGMSVLPGSMLPFATLTEGPVEQAAPSGGGGGGDTGQAVHHGAERSLLTVSLGLSHCSCISGDPIKRQPLRIYSSVVSPPDGTDGPSSSSSSSSSSSVQNLIALDEETATEDQTCYAALNEVLGWRRVNPFSPTMSGEWLADVLEPTYI